MAHHPDTLSFFRLKPLQVARVSEISETTAAAPLPADQRINFHIGNPIQDPRLASTYLQVALGMDASRTDLCSTDLEALLNQLAWQPGDKPKLQFLIRLIQKCNPYMPRGGYARKSPHPLVEKFCRWLENQQEPLIYDTGKETGRREIILASGGPHEAVRILLHALSAYIETTPARIICHRFQMAENVLTLPNLEVINLLAGEKAAGLEIEEILREKPQSPTFLVLGGILDEETRRKLRLLSIELPLFFIEANNAPNHLSLGREAKLTEKVIRIITPAVFSSNYCRMATVFLAGNAEYLNVIENVHFNLKGTPSASEVELLDFLLDQDAANRSVPAPAKPGRTHENDSRSGTESGGEQRTGLSLSEASNQDGMTSPSAKSAIGLPAADKFQKLDPRELLNLLQSRCQDEAWIHALEESFLNVFVRHQPQYRSEACQIVSGSSRTALAILGYHCGIEEVVVADLSWSYEQCFPTVRSVPLTKDLALDPDAMIEELNNLCRCDPTWREKGAVVIGNPHNATGRIFAEDDLRSLIRFCLQNRIRIIDDLAYQNLAPMEALPSLKTVRQIAGDLIRSEVVTDEQADLVLTVHSMSKTDCLAGARIAVAEIRTAELAQSFRQVNEQITPNLAAIFLCYLFYRNSEASVQAYWKLRNELFYERLQALLRAVENLPVERNPYGLTILPPAGSMYPILQLRELPTGVSLDRLASSLARGGIGLLPLATFARTEQGYEIGRKAFRLTLGGADCGEVLSSKTRRLLINLNRLLDNENALYNRQLLEHTHPIQAEQSSAHRVQNLWEDASGVILQKGEAICSRQLNSISNHLDHSFIRQDFLERYIPERLQVFHTHLVDWEMINAELMEKARREGGEWLRNRLETEFMADTLESRKEKFQTRLYDRTVHPTQMYSLKTEMALDTIVKTMIHQGSFAPGQAERAAQLLWMEYLGRNVAISSEDEADEILIEQDLLIAGQEYADLYTNIQLTPFLSFWSDWDGSSRPSGQGHRLAAMLVMENVRRMSHLLNLLRQADPGVKIEPEFSKEIALLPERNLRFTTLLNEITTLTQQLELRYRGILPFASEISPLKRLATDLHLRRDEARTLFQHNDRYERKMIELRQQRRDMLDYYFSVNRKLREHLHALIPAIVANRSNEALLYEMLIFRDILQRTVITPRIHQGIITARDQFAINTTVYNLFEVNALAGKYGNPGMIMALQISLSTQPEALIALDRKMRHQSDQARREYPDVEIPAIWSIPLFEDVDAVGNMRAYLDRIWDYAAQSRQTSQTQNQRFSEIICELFIAGSDLSQQISQANAAHHYLKAKYDIELWLAEHHLAEDVRLKLGSGEPMQRQGGYYSRQAGMPTFECTDANQELFKQNLPAPARMSTKYALTPMQGIFLAKDLRTFQSSLAEVVRSLPLEDYVGLHHHLQVSQIRHHCELIRAAETITESRLGSHLRSTSELERLTVGNNSTLYEEFLNELTANFRHILYGQEEDVVGIHIISYFIARLIPQLRDRPTSRRSASSGTDRGQQILVKIAEIIPLSKQGSLLRAIAHNQAQTAVLGVNQLTTGLFRALERFSQKHVAEAERERVISELILPQLPVYEILHNLRIYHDCGYDYVQRIENAFPAGNSAFVALREDQQAFYRYLPLLQQELLSRQGIPIKDFFSQGEFIPELLPTLRPDLAVLLQKDLFNTEWERAAEHLSNSVDSRWKAEVSKLLAMPVQISRWRAKIWDALGDSIYQRVQSFTELAAELYTFLPNRSPAPFVKSTRPAKPPVSLSGYLRSASPNDEMRSFLLGAVEYLSSVSEGNLEVPVSIIRALNDVKRIAQIEETSLSAETQDLIRFCLLQIARLAGENG